MVKAILYAKGPDRRTTPTPPGPAPEAIATTVSVSRADEGMNAPLLPGGTLSFDTASNHELLCHRKKVIDDPIQHEARWEPEKKEGKDHR